MPRCKIKSWPPLQALTAGHNFSESEGFTIKLALQKQQHFRFLQEGEDPCRPDEVEVLETYLVHRPYQRQNYSF